MTDIQINEIAGYVKEIGELKRTLAARTESLDTALASRAAILALARELAAKLVRGKACLACGVAGYMGCIEHNEGCPVKRLEVFCDL